MALSKYLVLLFVVIPHFTHTTPLLTMAEKSLADAPAEVLTALAAAKVDVETASTTEKKAFKKGGKPTKYSAISAAAANHAQAHKLKVQGVCPLTGLGIPIGGGYALPLKNPSDIETKTSPDAHRAAFPTSAKKGLLFISPLAAYYYVMTHDWPDANGKTSIAARDELLGWIEDFYRLRPAEIELLHRDHQLALARSSVIPGSDERFRPTAADALVLGGRLSYHKRQKRKNTSQKIAANKRRAVGGDTANPEPLPVESESSDTEEDAQVTSTSTEPEFEHEELTDEQDAQLTALLTGEAA